MSKVFTKSELLEALASVTPHIKTDLARTLDALAAIVQERAEAGQVVVLPGLGRFSMKHRAPRTGRNPATGLPVEIPAKRVLSFKPTKS